MADRRDCRGVLCRHLGGHRDRHSGQVHLGLWIQSVSTGAGIGIFDLVGMTFRKVNPNIIVRTKIMAVQAGLGEEAGITTKALEAHYLAGGNVPNVIRAMIAANRADIDLDYKRATADRPGRPQRARSRADERQSQGDRLPGPRLGQGVARRRGQERHPAQGEGPRHGADEPRPAGRRGHRGDDHRPRRRGHRQRHRLGRDAHRRAGEARSISKAVLDGRLDAQTAFEIVSIDIADIDVGDNIGARLQADQAEADTRVARAKAEERRAMAVAREQEMIAQVEENRAKVVEAEAEVPLAIAEAFRKGNLGIIDYYNLRNVQADTEMRRSIAGSTAPPMAQVTPS